MDSVCSFHFSKKQSLEKKGISNEQLKSIEELISKGMCSMNPWAPPPQDYLDNDTVVSLGEDWSVVVDIGHVDVHGSRVDPGRTAVIRRLNGECVT